jgi:penicillin-binding protein 2D
MQLGVLPAFTRVYYARLSMHARGIFSLPTNQTTIESTPESYKSSWWQRAPWWTKWLAIPLVGGFAGMTTLLLCLRMAPLPDESLANPTHIDSADGTRLAEWTLKGTQSQHIPLHQIPKFLQDATLAVEDVKFYTHHAFNPLSVMRALAVDIEHGKVVEGGSTITQQLAKNLYLNQDRTLTRKVREAMYAIQLELHETKSTILDQYLNIVYYGSGAYGVGAAAELYFNKPVQDLSLAESALLVGLPKGPSLYSPFVNESLAKERQRVVLDRMVKVGFLTQAAADEAYAQPLKFSHIHPPTIRAPYFTSVAVQEAEQQFHISSDDLYRGDISMSTTLDPVLQKAAERAITTSLSANSGLQAALVALDPQTGEIKAMVGGRDFATSPYNRVFAERQPGSTFKAILYTAALSHGWTPARQVNSQLTTFMYDDNKQYTVHDYGNFFAHRPLTLREALARSDNVYAVTTNMDVGPAEVIKTAHQMGISSPLQPFPSLALGVCQTSPLQLATAYATLANGGYRVKPHTLREVRDAAKSDVYQAAPSKERVVSEQVAFQMSDLLTSVMKPNGTGYAVSDFLHAPVAAKTGTTDTDVWMVGYTPSIVCAVWVGYDDNRPLNMTESHMAGPIWARFMGTAQARVPSDWFQPPSGMVKSVIDPLTAQLATDTCSSTETDYFVKGTEPVDSCTLHPATKMTPSRPWYKRLFPWS